MSETQVEDVSGDSFGGGDFEAAVGLDELAAAFAAAGIEATPGQANHYPERLALGGLCRRIGVNRWEPGVFNLDAIDPDPERLSAACARVSRVLAGMGIAHYFTVFLPPDASRRDNLFAEYRHGGAS